MTAVELPDIGAPARRALESAGILTLNDLTGYTAVTVARLHGMGPRALEQLSAAMAQHGLSFADTEADAEGHPS